ncbi:transcriptional regulator [Bacteroidia bacterium]|nr:transcriptional regulator [Bacteroidia bacterium]
MNRINRVSAILVQLQSRSLVTAQHIADRFGISLRTVYRDIRALEEAGIPIIGNPGAGYSLVHGFKLPPLMFTQEEAFAFLTAEKLVRELTDSGNSEHYRSGMNKIRAVMRFADKDVLETVEANMDILQTFKSPSGANMLQLLLQSLARKKALQISYFTDSRQEVTERKVEPAGIFFSRAHWYLTAFCLTRKEYRTFRVDRIQSIQELSEDFSKQHPPLKDFLDDVRKTQGLEEVVILLDKDKASRIDDDKYYHGLFAEKVTGGSMELSFLTFSLDKFARWYLSFADIATIVEPERLKDKVRAILKDISV